MKRLVLALALIWAHADAGETAQSGLVLSLPVDCVIGETCFVQNHFDHDPGPGFRDYACGGLGYDGHRGIDIRVADLPAMARGIAVIAAGPGRILGVRDGMTDIDVRLIDAATIADRKAGNGVVIDHDGGWQTQYSHLRRGSLRVAVGDIVAAGDVIGMIGMSGNAAFPHVEFSVRRQGVPVDPFIGLGAATECGVGGGTLWHQDALASLPYTPSGMLAAGFATRRPTWSEARRGDYAQGAPRRDAPALVFWTSIFGGQADDQFTLLLIAPDGETLAESRNVLKKDKALLFSLTGIKRPGDIWPEGVYRGEFRLYREIDGAPRELLSERREITLR